MAVHLAYWLAGTWRAGPASAAVASCRPDSADTGCTWAWAAEPVAALAGTVAADYTGRALTAADRRTYCSD